LGVISENATEANASVAERMFVERTLYPKLVRIAEKITQALLPFWGEGYVAQFDDIRPTDDAARLEELRAAHGVLTINELRARYFQLPPVSWGDRLSAEPYTS
jgi:phage portal protein BeeE